MSTPIKLSFHDEAKLYLLYMVAGAAAIPAGICYAILVAKGWERWWTVVPLLALGLATALFAWKYLEKRLYSRIAAPAVSETYNAKVSAFGLRTVGNFAAIASIAALCLQPPNQSHNQTESGGQGNAATALSHIG